MGCAMSHNARVAAAPSAISRHACGSHMLTAMTNDVWKQGEARLLPSQDLASAEDLDRGEIKLNHLL